MKPRRPGAQCAGCGMGHYLAPRLSLAPTQDPTPCPLTAWECSQVTKLQFRVISLSHSIHAHAPPFRWQGGTPLTTHARAPPLRWQEGTPLTTHIHAPSLRWQEAGRRTTHDPHARAPPLRWQEGTWPTTHARAPPLRWQGGTRLTTPRPPAVSFVCGRATPRLLTCHVVGGRARLAIPRLLAFSPVGRRRTARNPMADHVPPCWQESPQLADPRPLTCGPVCRRRIAHDPTARSSRTVCARSGTRPPRPLRIVCVRSGTRPPRPRTPTNARERPRTPSNAHERPRTPTNAHRAHTNCPRA